MNADEEKKQAETKTKAEVERGKEKTRRLFEQAVKKKMKNDKKNEDSQTRQILNLVRDLSNQDDLIEGQPEVTHILHKLVKFAEERRATHAASQEHFEGLNAKFFWPSIILTTFTSAASFMATQFPEKSSEFNVGIGIMASISTLIVALSETYRYGSKAEQHGLAAESYENLRTKLFFKSIQLHNKDSFDVCEFKGFFTSIEDQITEIARQCKDLVPAAIVKDYKEHRYISMLESLSRNIRTVIAQNQFSKTVDKIINGEEITLEEIYKIDNFKFKKKKKKDLLRFKDKNEFEK